MDRIHIVHAFRNETVDTNGFDFDVALACLPHKALLTLVFLREARSARRGHVPYPSPEG